MFVAETAGKLAELLERQYGRSRAGEIVHEASAQGRISEERASSVLLQSNVIIYGKTGPELLKLLDGAACLIGINSQPVSMAQSRPFRPSVRQRRRGGFSFAPSQPL